MLKYLIEEEELDLDIAELPDDPRLIALADYLEVSPYNIEPDSSYYDNGYKNLEDDTSYVVFTDEEADEEALERIRSLVFDEVLSEYFNDEFICNYLVRGAFDEERDNYFYDLYNYNYDLDELIKEAIDLELISQEEVDIRKDKDDEDLEEDLKNMLIEYRCNEYEDSLDWANEYLSEEEMAESACSNPSEYLDTDSLIDDLLSEGRANWIPGLYDNKELDLDVKDKNGNWLFAYRLD